MAAPARHSRSYDPRRGLQRRTARVNRRLLDGPGAEVNCNQRIRKNPWNTVTCRLGVVSITHMNALATETNLYHPAKSLTVPPRLEIIGADKEDAVPMFAIHRRTHVLGRAIAAILPAAPITDTTAALIPARP